MSGAGLIPGRMPAQVVLADMARCLAAIAEDRKMVAAASNRALMTYLAAASATQFGGDATLALSGARDQASTHVRDLMIYLAHTKFGLTQKEAGDVTGQSRQAATRAVQRIEARREDGVFNWKLDQLEMLIDQMMREAA
ncbi:hypothetical protein [Hyphomonas sp.]|jgi:hypothetical protein|uniref:hypothetical protein n=1 Tax=Hyphomonas sp. TaxID=87 RepID=UPI0032EC54E6